ncbi:MAG: exodeoxyribonuclease VII large subunit [Proteobacteria bacterium]|nr:exodeoxyribonuclease VII large subunit [Pseudomonadota bacterium]
MDSLAIPRSVLTPSQIATLARDLLEGNFPMVWVEGELGGVSRPASGHLYFNLKDARAQLRCAMWKQRANLLRFAPREGMQVLIRGRLTVYEARGEMQMSVEHMEEAGEGALRRAFDELKNKLATEGLFASERKRAFPNFVRRLGIVTSPSGAAIRDVLHVLARRFPLLDVEIVPSSVQGAAAVAQLVQALRWASDSGRYDAILLTRGGGSLEDLWCFNEEALVRAIVASQVPVMSAIGHEIDTTLADFAADARAPTPSAAAELLVPDRGELLALLDRQCGRANSAWQRTLDAAVQRTDRAWLRLHALRPQARLEHGAMRLTDLQRRLMELPQRRAQRDRERLTTLALRLRAAHPQRRLADQHDRLARALHGLQRGYALSAERGELRVLALARALESVSPLATLQRGFAILHDEGGRVVRWVAQAYPDQRLSARLADGDLALRVERIE